MRGARRARRAVARKVDARLRRGDHLSARSCRLRGCGANSVLGGQNLFADGIAAANDFRIADPGGFGLLSELAVPIYNEHDSYDMRSRQHVIELDDRGQVSGLTISQHKADVFDLPQSVLDDYYPAFMRFGKMLQLDRYLMRFSLRAGECITFDNHRIVHGRAAYSASSGTRYLRGTYIDRGDLAGWAKVHHGMRSGGTFPPFVPATCSLSTSMMPQ